MALSSSHSPEDLRLDNDRIAISVFFESIENKNHAISSPKIGTWHKIGNTDYCVLALHTEDATQRSGKVEQTKVILTSNTMVMSENTMRMLSVDEFNDIKEPTIDSYSAMVIRPFSDYDKALLWSVYSTNNRKVALSVQKTVAKIQ